MLIDYATLCQIEDQRNIAGMKIVADESIAVGGGYAFVGPAGTWANVAIGQGLGRAVETREIDELIEIYRARGIEPRIEVSCYAHVSLTKHAVARGFQLVETQFVLVRPLNMAAEAMGGVRFDAIKNEASGLELVQIDKHDHAVVDAVAMVIAKGFATPGQPVTQTDIGLIVKAIGQVESVTIGAKLDGQFIGAGMMDVVEVMGDFAGVGSSAKVSGLFALSVLPAFRKRGVQLAIMRERLRIAKQHGALFAAIGSAPASPTLRNARRAGFMIAGVKSVLIRPEAGLVGRPT